MLRVDGTKAATPATRQGGVPSCPCRPRPSRAPARAVSPTTSGSRNRWVDHVVGQSVRLVLLPPRGSMDYRALAEFITTSLLAFSVLVIAMGFTIRVFVAPVLREFLGYDDAQVEALRTASALA